MGDFQPQALANKAWAFATADVLDKRLCIALAQAVSPALDLPEIASVCTLCQLHQWQLWLSLERNELTNLPYEIGELSRLEHLDASNNQLACLPRSIGKLQALSSLVVWANRLAAFPAELRPKTASQLLSILAGQGHSDPAEAAALQAQMQPFRHWLSGLQLVERISRCECRCVPARPACACVLVRALALTAQGRDVAFRHEPSAHVARASRNV